jgi:hypothetical protein
MKYDSIIELVKTHAPLETNPEAQTVHEPVAPFVHVWQLVSLPAYLWSNDDKMPLMQLTACTGAPAARK